MALVAQWLRLQVSPTGILVQAILQILTYLPEFFVLCKSKDIDGFVDIVIVGITAWHVLESRA